MRPTDLTGLILNPPNSRAGFVWGTVTQTDPLEVQLAADAAPIQPTAVATAGPYRVGQRLFCCWQGPTLTTLSTPERLAGTLIAWGTRQGKKVTAGSETPYLEVQADLQPGRHYEIRASDITWWATPVNRAMRVSLRYGPTPISTSTGTRKRGYVVASWTGRGAQEPVSLTGDVQVTQPERWAGLITIDPADAAEGRIYDARLGIYDMGPAIPDTGIHH